MSTSAAHNVASTTQNYATMLMVWFAANPFVEYKPASDDLLTKLDEDWASQEVLHDAVSQAYKHTQPLNAHVNVLLDHYYDLVALDGSTVEADTLAKFLPLKQAGSQEKVQLPEVAMESAFWMRQASKEQLRDRFVEIAVLKKILEKVQASLVGAIAECKLALGRKVAAQRLATGDGSGEQKPERSFGGLDGSADDDVAAPGTPIPDIRYLGKWLDFSKPPKSG